MIEQPETRCTCGLLEFCPQDCQVESEKAILIEQLYSLIETIESQAGKETIIRAINYIERS